MPLLLSHLAYLHLTLDLHVIRQKAESKKKKNSIVKQTEVCSSYLATQLFLFTDFLCTRMRVMRMYICAVFACVWVCMHTNIKDRDGVRCPPGMIFA